MLNAVVGAAGLDATLAALERGKRVALANKETLVMGGALVTAACASGGGELVPVDSEHSAILQCITGRPGVEVRRVDHHGVGRAVPRNGRAEQLERATLDDALRHPTWRMGRKITVDSATLANKALEVIEAHFLFGLPYDRIEVVVHPQSVVHSFVEFVDGSVLAQIGVPSMELAGAVCADASGPRCGHRGTTVRPGGALAADVRAGRRRAVSRRSRSASRRAGAAARRRRCSTRRTRRPSRLFLDGRIRFGDIGAAIADALDALGAPRRRHREAILAADAPRARLVQERFGC